MNQLNLIGVDVGFAARKATSGVAAISNGHLRVGRADATATTRRRIWDCVRSAAVMAIDAPILSGGTSHVRTCERVLAGGLFQRRCKPGFSHVPGTGLHFRHAGAEAVSQLREVASEGTTAMFPRVDGLGNFVEAFPNAFLGVCLRDRTYSAMPRLRRGRKFDWLYDNWREERLFDSLRESLDAYRDVAMIVDACARNTDHEERAALVCLLTAACVALGQFTAVGERTGGFLFLPPLTLWADWAKREIVSQRSRPDRSTEFWSNGEVQDVKTAPAATLDLATL